MKITEVRNNLFGLSDLKGLIKENMFDEARPAAGSLSLGKFFSEHPEFIGVSYTDTGEIGVEFRNALHDYFNGLTNGFPTNDEYATMPSAQRRIFATRIKQANRGLRGQHLNANKIIAIPNDPYGDKPVTISKTPLEHLKDFFVENGGLGFVFNEEVGYNSDLLEKYVDGLKSLAIMAGEYFNKVGVRISSFNDAEIQVGNETDPFALYLFFYYQNFCETRGNGGGKKTNTYLQNVQNQNIKEYIKYTSHITPNVFNLILNCGESSIDGLSEKIIAEGFGGDEFKVSRSMAYLKRYSQYYPGLLNMEFLKNLMSCFKITSYDSLLDPIEVVSEKLITDGILTWCRNSSDDAVKELVKPVLNRDMDSCSPVEKIFLTAESIDRLLQASYKKYGEGPNGNKMTIGLLLEDAEKGIDYWNSLSRGGKIPKAQIKLRTIYNTERGKYSEMSSLPFWRILNLDREIKDKTQSDIFYFLIGNSSKDVKWTYEYNRNKKADIDLAGKSVDILGETNRNTFCFEYQGEQHYRPLTVTYDDYATFPFFTKMREYILTECGFVQKTVGGTKFFSGPENADMARMAEIKQIILGAYKKFYSELSTSLTGDYKITGRLEEAFKFGKVNKKLKFENDAQLLSYFQKILEECKNTDVFEEPPMEDVVPYVGSPRRFLDEVKTAQDMGRDIEKREIIRRKEKLGWVLSYIIPKRATEDEKKYTDELAGSENLVFPWNAEGRERLLYFMKQNKILADGVLEESTLFQQIISELLTD